MSGNIVISTGDLISIADLQQLEPVLQIRLMLMQI